MTSRIDNIYLHHHSSRAVCCFKSSLTLTSSHSCPSLLHNYIVLLASQYVVFYDCISLFASFHQSLLQVLTSSSAPLPSTLTGGLQQTNHSHIGGSGGLGTIGTIGGNAGGNMGSMGGNMGMGSGGGYGSHDSNNHHNNNNNNNNSKAIPMGTSNMYDNIHHESLCSFLLLCEITSVVLYE